MSQAPELQLKQKNRVELRNQERFMDKMGLQLIYR